MGGQNAVGFAQMTSKGTGPHAGSRMESNSQGSGIRCGRFEFDCSLSIQLIQTEQQKIEDVSWLLFLEGVAEESGRAHGHGMS